jgi:hypothetical protein
VHERFLEIGAVEFIEPVDFVHQRPQLNGADLDRRLALRERNGMEPRQCQGDFAEIALGRNNPSAAHAHVFLLVSWCGVVTY